MCAAAERRIQRIERERKPGRGVIKQYRPLGALITMVLERLTEFTDPSTSPARRVAILKMVPMLWPYTVEALYRGEYLARKERRERSPSEAAERCVAQRLNISPALVHKLSSDVRRLRRKGEAGPEWPVLTLSEFDEWRAKGELPWTSRSELASSMTKVTAPTNDNAQLQRPFTGPSMSLGH
jgi:hypothetical protein